MLIGTRERGAGVAINSMAKKLLSRAMRRDPIRMVSRRILRDVEQWLTRGSGETWKHRDFGLGAVAEYQVRELLHGSRYLYGMHEYVASSVFVANISAGSVVLDVGANLGEYTVLAGRAAGQQGSVIAYEPNPTARQRIARNVDASGLRNVEISPHALASDDGVATLRVPGDESGLGTLRPGVLGTEFRVELRRLDGILDKQHRGRISMIKLDVEGFEFQVIEGAQETIAESRPVILYECAEETFITRRGRILTPTMAFLEDAGYNNFVITMTRRGRWALKTANKVDPRKYREPWEVLMVVGIHRDEMHHSHLSGISPLRRCGVFERLGR
jgi:FkbM family methyltransferase